MEIAVMVITLVIMGEWVQLGKPNISPAEMLLKSIRSEKTRYYIQIIIQTLLDDTALSIGQYLSRGPVRAKDLQAACVSDEKIPHVSNFYRQLNRLVAAGIIREFETQENQATGGPRAKYYEIADIDAVRALESREEIYGRYMETETLLREYHEEIKECKLKIESACRIFKNMGVKNPEKMIDDEMTDPDFSVINYLNPE